jgi:hypothetical protein
MHLYFIHILAIYHIISSSWIPPRTDTGVHPRIMLIILDRFINVADIRSQLRPSTPPIIVDWQAQRRLTDR